MKPIRLLALAAAVAAPAASAQEPPADRLVALRAEVAALRAELDERRGEAPWTADARREEVRRVVDDAVEAAGEAAAFGGHDGQRFFLAGPGHRLDIEGLLQFQHVALRDAAGGPRDDASGFQVRRARLAFSGHVVDEKLSYFLQLDADREGGGVDVLDAQVQWTFDGGVKLQAGLFKLPFLYEQLLSAKRLLAADRAQSSNFFTLNRSEQVQLVVPVADRVRLSAALSDGGTRSNTGSLNDASDWAFTTRAQSRLLGEWDNLKDLVAWELGPQLFLGLAGHVQDDDSVVGGNTLSAWTADAVFKLDSVAAMAAVMGADAGGFSARGFVVQGGWSLTEKVQPFVRYDFIDDGEVDAVHAVTAGVNAYLRGQDLRLTLDGVYVPEAPAGFGGTTPEALAGGAFGGGLGLAPPGGGDLLSIRTQLQLLF
ncbi:phosphate porin [Phycisphaera mikurensis]|uniref:Phosphate-selective porin O/P family protein n=1 Tax=Phycisphaera mikurensis (strain NBRC 102666 / KCTC 22515 / FYK2301M01) TaxID=1142394 RepID=I0IDE6_PHYMF|nr:phosphate porin [Phycisphaera mikurensis]MBB6443330.1 hypothetical protein [Phycisphaera mikurensis]BAM03284.1 phosphate-selective porin O/P family protein [Phycisphaera mikurensis NBRC 102666]